MSTYRLLFFDNDAKLIDAYRNNITTASDIPVQFVEIDVREITKTYNVTVIVSPANSIGFMDGGIDIFYMQLFPGIQDRVQNRIKSFDITTHLGRYYLPIGSAVLVNTNDETCPLLACVPTMFLPDDIRGLDNVYWGIRGLLRLLDTSITIGDILVAIPCMGTGVGKLSGETSAKQVNDAIIDHCRYRKGDKDVKMHNVVNAKEIEGFKHAYVLSECATKQRNSYQNTELNGLPDQDNVLDTLLPLCENNTPK
jgi:O-acetyl-ADP-ribose deacetylase (regulator of RNase III)